MSMHRTILVIADSVTSEHNSEHQLQQDSDVAYQILIEQYHTPISALSQSQPIDGILLELHSPHSDSIKLLEQLKQQMGDRCPPIVVIDRDNAEVAVQALKSGAADYLVKDRMTPDDLRLAMRSAIENAELRQKLQHSQEQFQTSVENMLDCFGIFSSIRDETGQIIDFRIDYLNEAACENNRLPKSRQIGRELCDVLPAHRTSGLFEAYCRLVETAEPLIKDSLIYDDTYGEQHLIRAFDIRATKLNDGFVASWRDVTERKQLELNLNRTVTDLQQHEAAIQQLNRDLTHRVAELQSLLDILPVGIAIADDPACAQMQHNAYLRQLLGVEPGNNISKSAPAEEQPPYRVFQDGQEVPTENLPMQVAVRLGVEVRDAEFDILRPDGTIHQLLSYATPLRDDQNQIRGVVGAFLDITKRNQDAAVLKASQQRYRELAEAMPQMVWTADANGVINYRNQRWYEYTGLSEAESIGPTQAHTVHPDDRDRTLQQWNTAIANGEPFETECRFRRWDGEYHWCICRAIPTRASQTQITGWIGTLTNIDDIKRSEALVQQQLAEIEAIYQSAPIGLNVLDTDLRFVRINQRLADMNGLPIAAHLGRTIRELFPALADTIEQLLRPILTTGEPLLNVAIQGETPSQPGIQRTWLEHFLPLKAGDRVVGISTVCEEITEQIQIETALRQSEERFRNMADNAPVMIWVTDATGYCTYLNQGWYDFTGQTEETGLGFGWLNAVHPDDGESAKGAFLEANKHHKPLRLEYRLRHKDGNYRSCIDAASPWFGEEGAFKGYIGSVIDISDRKHAEEALRQSEERYRTLFETMNQGFCVAEVLFDQHNRAIDYRLLEVNSVFEKHSGLKNAQGKTARELIPDIEPYWAELYGNVVLTGEPVRYENYSDAMDRWFDVSAFRLGPPEHPKVAILFEDISQRKQTEQELQDSETRFRTLADNISQFAWMADENGWILWYNQRWFDYTGATLEAMQGWGWQKVHHPEHVDRVAQKFRHCIETGETWEDTFPLRGKDGQYRWFLSRAIPVRDQQGQVLRWFGTNTDITDRTQTEAALQASEERYRSLIEATAQIIWHVHGDQGEFTTEQPGWSAFTGQTYDELKGWGWLNAVHPDDRATTTQIWLTALKNRAFYEVEHRLRRHDGMYRYMSVRAVPVLESDNSIREWIGVHTDVTERKQAEAERERLFRQEQAAREAAERANRIKDEFLAVLSHELRSPLNPILGWTKLLQMRQFDKTQTHRALATIERNAKLQTQLIDDLLDIAKILRGKLSLSMASVNLASVIESATETVKAAAVAKSISLRSVLPNLGQVSGDAARLQQIVWNLLSNAIKFTPMGGQVDIRLERDGNQAKVTVSDTGKGINAEFLPYIFESFRQEDASITRQHGGLGLGLAIVRQLVEAHGGVITANSPGEGLGATFIVQLPLMNHVPDIQPIEALPQQELDLAGIRVLAIDDDPDARELLTALLTQYGAKVLTVDSASKVLASLTSFQPDILISDIGMPEVDGYTLIQQVRALPAAVGGQIPAIALTAYAREDDHQQSINSGFQQHVAKPLDPEQLVQAVLTLTDRSNN